MNSNTPYSTLEPNLILESIETLGLRCSGSLLALNSYENRVYQVGMEEGPPLIAKFYRPHRWTNAAILEEHQFAQELASHEIPIIAPLTMQGATLHEYGGFRFALFPRRGGRPLEIDNKEQLEWMGRFIGRLHALGAAKKFQHRMHLDVESYGYAPYRFLLENNFIPHDVKTNYCQTVESLLARMEEIFANLGPLNYIRLHGDCHAGNVLWNDTGPQIVDLDDCLMGPAIQDIWMLLSGTTESEIKDQLHFILEGYEEFHDFNYAEFRLVETLRTLRMIHYSAWLAKRWEDPTFPLNFPWFNTGRYWDQQLQDLREQLALIS